MYRRIILIIFAGFIGLTACSKFELAEQEFLLTEITVGQEGVVKTSLSGTNVLWSSGDEIKVFAQGNGAGNTFTLTGGAGTGSGTFSGVRPQYTGSENYFVVYPSTATYNGGSTFTFTLPSEVDYTAGTFAPGSNPMLSGTSSSFGSFTMKNLCGVLKLKLKGSIKVSRLELTFDKAVTGPGTVSRGGNTLSMTGSADSYKTVAVNCSSAQQLSTSSAKEFFVVIPAGSYSSLTLNAVLQDGSISSKSLTEPFTITRSAQTTMETTMPAARASLQVWSFNVACQSNDGNSNWGDNHKWNVRRPGIYAFFNENQPDIIGTQECEYRQRVNILDNTEGYAAYGLGVEYGKESSGSEGYLWNKKDYNTDSSNAIFYKTDKFEVLDKGTFWLSSNPSSVGSDDGHNCAWIKFQWKENGYRFYFFNTHLDDQGKSARAESARLIAERIRTIAGEEETVFLGGDFNTVSTDTALEPLKEVLKNTQMEVKKADKTLSFNNFGKKDGAAAIDHLFFRDAKAKSFEVVDEKFKVRYISDHFPVFADYEI